MRIVYLNPVGSLGGAERVLLQMLAGIRRERPDWNLSLIAMTSGPLLEEALKLGVRSLCLPMPPALAGVGDSLFRGRNKLFMAFQIVSKVIILFPSLMKYLRKLREMLRKLRPSLVHSNGIKSHLLARWIVPASVPIVWHVHDYYSLRPLTGRLLRRVQNGVRSLLAISRSVAEDVQLILPDIPVRILFNSVDPERFSPGVSKGSWLDCLAGLSLPATPLLRVGLIATFARWKGHDLFLQATHHFVQTHPDINVRFYVIGGPIYHTQAQWTLAKLTQLAKSLHLQNQIGFIPFQQDPVDVYRSLDVVVHASTKPEPFGLTIAEAMSCGRSVIVSQAGGASELFTPEVDALGVSPGNGAELVVALNRLLRDASLRERIGDAARQTALKKFSPDRFTRELLDCYDSIMK